MRFLMLSHPAPATLASPPSPKLMEEMGQLIEETTKSGVLLATGGISPGRPGVRVRSTGGKVSVTDGPYAEAKELIGGFAVVELPSKEEAVVFAKRFLAIVGDGECEIHELA